MIIDNKKNSYNVNNNFQDKMKKSQNNERISIKNMFTKDIFSINGGDTNNNDEMLNKSLSMLNDRLEKGLISPEEFNKKCDELAKKRNK